MVLKMAWNYVELFYTVVIQIAVASSQCYTRTHRQGWTGRRKTYLGQPGANTSHGSHYYLYVFMMRGRLQASKFFSLEAVPKRPEKHTSHPHPHIHKVFMHFIQAMWLAPRTPKPVPCTSWLNTWFHSGWCMFCLLADTVLPSVSSINTWN